MKKIGLLIPSIYSGGAERVATRFSTILSEDYEVYLIVYEDTYKLYPFSGTLLNMDLKATKGKAKKVWLALERSKMLKRIKKSYHLETVLSFMDSPNLCNILGKVKGCKSIVSVRNYEIDNYSGIKQAIMTAFYWFLYNQADCVVPVTRQLGNDLVSKYHFPEEKIVTVYNPYNLQEIMGLEKEQVDSEHEAFFEKHKNDYVYISVGRNVYQKGFWHLIRAFAEVHSKKPNTALVIVGKDEYGDKMKQLVRELQIEDAVLLTGFRSDPFRYVNRSDVYVMTSLFEGFPNALVEAMATGTPVITTDCKSGPREILMETPNFEETISERKECDYGIIIPMLSRQEKWDSSPADQTEIVLAETMQWSYENPQKMKMYADKAVQRVSCYSYEAAKNRLKEIL